MSEEDAAIVKGMLHRGDRQHDIAAWFGVNGGRIGEINSGDKFPNVKMVTTGLPPSGPYLSGRQSSLLQEKLESLKKTLLDLSNEVDEFLP